MAKKGILGSVIGTFQENAKVREIRRNKLLFYPKSYHASLDLSDNLGEYRNAVAAIRDKYESYDLTQQFVKREMANELKLARINFHVRAENLSTFALRVGSELEQRYGDPERAAYLKNLELQLDQNEEILKTKSTAAWDIQDELLTIVKDDINPYALDELDAKSSKDWSKMAKMLEEKLAERGLVPQEQGYEEGIKEVWNEVIDEVGEKKPQNLDKMLNELEAMRKEEIEKIEQNSKHRDSQDLAR